jgi:hypothetical protein
MKMILTRDTFPVKYYFKPEIPTYGTCPHYGIPDMKRRERLKKREPFLTALLRILF